MWSLKFQSLYINCFHSAVALNLECRLAVTPGTDHHRAVGVAYWPDCKKGKKVSRIGVVGRHVHF